jgi:LEA14-like dessication related protein
MSSSDKKFKESIKKNFVDDPETFHAIDEYVIDVSEYLDIKSETEVDDKTLTIIYNLYRQEKSAFETASFIKKQKKWISDIRKHLLPFHIVKTKNDFGLGNNGVMYDIYFNDIKIAKYEDEGWIPECGGETTIEFLDKISKNTFMQFDEKLITQVDKKVIKDEQKYTVVFLKEEVEKSFVEFFYENKIPELMIEYQWKWKKDLWKSKKDLLCINVDDMIQAVLCYAEEK